MSDPAVEAAQRAWARVSEFTAETDPFAAMEAAAREALAPIRELHRLGYWVYTGEGTSSRTGAPNAPVRMVSMPVTAGPGAVGPSGARATRRSRSGGLTARLPVSSTPPTN